MAIEFRCSSCQQLLRVSDDSAGKNAKCPKCGTVVAVPAASPAAAPGSAPLSAPFPSPTPFSAPAAAPKPASPQESPFQPAGNPFSEGNPFAAASPLAGGGAPGAPVNPYAASAGGFSPSVPAAYQSGAIIPQRVGVEQIFNYAWQIWKENLGLLVAVTLVVLLISIPIDGAIGFAEEMLKQEGDETIANIVVLFGNLFSTAVDVFLGIGQAQIALKLARRQRAEFSDLFSGGPRFLPVLGGSILAGIVASIGFLLCIVPGVILCLMFWPFYYLVVERKTGVLDSFSLANKITEGNWGTAFLLWLLSVAIVILGFLAVCVGLLFAIPLITMMWVVAYLMMSGQLSPYPLYSAPAPQAMPGKW